MDSTIATFMTIDTASRDSNKPARTFEEAGARIGDLCARDDAFIHPLSRTRLWSHGAKTPRAVLYLQGYTDSVQQFSVLGDRLFARGYNVYAPRLPYHGYQARLTQDHGKLTAGEMVEWASAAVDAAVGLGDRLTVVGLSLGGVMATWVAEQRADVDRVLIVAPAYGTSAVPPALTVPTAKIVKRLPNLFVWWDPRLREEQGFDYTYPRFSTHTLARLFILSGELLEQARAKPPAARSVWMITNANDAAVSNALCDAFVRAWQAHKTDQVRTYQYPKELNIPHDVMDPGDPAVKPDVVYPPLLEMIDAD